MIHRYAACTGHHPHHTRSGAGTRAKRVKRRVAGSGTWLTMVVGGNAPEAITALGLGTVTDVSGVSANAHPSMDITEFPIVTDVSCVS